VDFILYEGSGNSKKELVLHGETLDFAYEQMPTGEWFKKIKVCISNRSKVKYYCAVLYLSNTFQVYGNMLDGKVIGLNPGETAWLQNGQALELDLEEHIVEFNFPASVFYLKLIASVDAFQIEPLEQSGLPPPSNRIGRGFEELTRGVKIKEEQAIGEVDWFTRTLCFRGKLPMAGNK
jgi:hypothetical protein